jgi:transposase
MKSSEPIRASSYSSDLRTKVVGAVRRGISKSETDRRFWISRCTAHHYLKRLEEEGSLAPIAAYGEVEPQH